jgi:DNA invertase Pin-like site-specific DNA recombinase
METPNLKRAVAYARVSTLLGQDPELQLVHIRQFAQARGFILNQEYVDHGVSGARERRPALDRMIADARRGKFNVLIVSGIDRIGRNVRHLLNLIHELGEYQVALVSLRENLDFTTGIGKATLVILGAIAELERDLTRERIRCALAAKRLTAQQNGTAWRCGPPVKVTDDVIAEVLHLRSQGLSIRQIEQHMKRKISRGSIGRIIKAECPTNLAKNEPHPSEIISTKIEITASHNDLIV